MKKINSKLGWWNKFYKNKNYERSVYSDPLTAKLAGEWLSTSDIKEVEDWGCGYGGFANYLSKDQKYIGVDGSESLYANKIVELIEYQTSVDAIHMRHVLEHNQDWKIILENFLKSFNKKAVLTIFTPFANESKIIRTYSNYLGTGVNMVDISLSEKELDSIFSKEKNLTIQTKFNIVTDSQYKIEHMYFFEKKSI